MFLKYCCIFCHLPFRCLVCHHQIILSVQFPFNILQFLFHTNKKFDKKGHIYSCHYDLIKCFSFCIFYLGWMIIYCNCFIIFIFISPRGITSYHFICLHWWIQSCNLKINNFQGCVVSLEAQSYCQYLFCPLLVEILSCFSNWDRVLCQTNKTKIIKNNVRLNLNLLCWRLLSLGRVCLLIVICTRLE